MTGPQRPTTQKLLELKGTTLCVPELLALFQMRLRNHQTVPVIVEALQDAGLCTVPSFTTCSPTTPMLVVAQDTIPTEADNEQEELAPGTLPQQSFKVGDVPSAIAGLDSVDSTARLSDATHIMWQKNYSQLPVIDGTSHLKGIVTWSSVAARYENGTKPTLANTMIKEELPVAEVHQALFPHLSVLARHGYVLVRSNSGSLSGIITAADITYRFHAMAQPFFLVGEIEWRLRKCLGPKLTGDPVKAVQPSGRKTGDVADLMFGEYLKLLDGEQNNPALRPLADVNWHTLGWSLVNRAQFLHQLRQVKSIRNRIAHFDDQPVADQEIVELTEFSGLLKQLL